MQRAGIRVGRTVRDAQEVLTMDDLIDRNALLLKQKEHADLFAGSTVHDDIVRRDEAIAALSEIINAPAVNRWIPVEDVLPEVYEKVLTYNDEGIIHDNFRLNLRDGSVGWSQGWGITHWQPRPEPPEKK